MGFTNNYLTEINCSLPRITELNTIEVPAEGVGLNGGKIVDTTGTEYPNVYGTSRSTYSLQNTALFLSSDTTLPSVDDYNDTIGRIARFVMPNAGFVSRNIVRYPGKTTFTMVYTNDTDAPVTVAKIGLTNSYFMIYYYTTTKNTASNKFVLMATELLPEPVVVQPGETASFSLTLDYTKLITEARAN